MANVRVAASADITFGMISVPVKLYLTASPDRMSFNLICPDGSRAKQKWVSEKTGEEVEYDTLLRGVEVSKGKYITFSNEELSALADEKTGIELIAIVPASRIDLSAVYVEKAYFLGPDKSDKAYRLLHSCLKELNKVCIAKWYTRGKDNLVAISAGKDEVLYLHQLYYQNELREVSIMFSKGSEPNEKENSLGLRLLRQYAERTFNIGEHKDLYGERVNLAVAKKLEGQLVEPSLRQRFTGMAIDLATLLEESLKKEQE